MGSSAEIIELARLSGVPNDPGSTYRPGAKTASGKPSWHASDDAVDFMGFNQDRLASFFLAIPTLEVIHYSEATGQYYGRNSKGNPIDPAKNAELFKQHHNHLHVAMSKEQTSGILDEIHRGVRSVKDMVSGAVGGVLGSVAPKNVTEALGSAGSALHSLASSAVSIGNLAGKISGLFLPTAIMRGFMAMFGTIFILIGIWFLAREVRESTP